MWTEIGATHVADDSRTAIGVISPVLAGTYQAWADEHLADLPSGPDQDADGDGWSNLLEYLFGTNPTSRSSMPHLPRAQLDASGNPFFHVLIDPGAQDITADILWSTDLRSWHDSGATVDGLTVGIAMEPQGLDFDSGLLLMKIQASLSGGNAPRLFFRLRAVLD